MKPPKKQTSNPQIYPILFDHNLHNFSQTNNFLSATSDFSFVEYSFSQIKTDSMNINLSNKEGFYFLYCWKGNIVLSLNGRKNNIAPFQSSIIFDKNNSGLQLSFNDTETYAFCVISFTKPESSTQKINNTFYSKFLNAFQSNVVKDRCIFTGKPNLKLLDNINSISRMTRENISSEFIIEGLIYQALGLKLQQLVASLNTEVINRGSLSIREMEQVETISTFIKQNPGLEYSLKFLCSETGLSTPKLQEGFKIMHGKTVTNYIRNVRLEEAADLINETELNISEIVYAIGFTSRSYFSKIFKSKFNCSPKHYQDQRKSIAVRA